MTINRPAIIVYLRQLFYGFEEYECPPFTAEGYAGHIAHMKTHARQFGELLELKVALHHLQTLTFQELTTYTVSDHYAEEEEIRTVLQLAIDSDWIEVVGWEMALQEEITWLDVPVYEWFPQKRKVINPDSTP